jgi:cation transport ATPase
MDKTGTMTKGDVAVTEVITMGGQTSNQTLLAIAHEVEAMSSHPIAKAVVKHCAKAKESNAAVAVIAVDDYEEVVGCGIQATVVVNNVRHAVRMGKKGWAGSAEVGGGENPQRGDVGSGYVQPLLFFCARPPSPHFPPFSSPRYGTQIYLALDQQLAAIFHLSDSLREETGSVISYLVEAMGTDVYMCTGDQQATAEAVADAVGIPTSRVVAGCMPADKQVRAEASAKASEASKKKSGSGAPTTDGRAGELTSAPTRDASERAEEGAGERANHFFTTSSFSLAPASFASLARQTISPYLHTNKLLLLPRLLRPPQQPP